MQRITHKRIRISWLLLLVYLQLQSTPYLAPSLVVWVAITVLHLSPRRAFCSPCLCRAKGVKSTRAPPYYQLL